MGTHWLKTTLTKVEKKGPESGQGEL